MKDLTYFDVCFLFLYFYFLLFFISIANYIIILKLMVAVALGPWALNSEDRAEP